MMGAQVLAGSSGTSQRLRKRVGDCPSVISRTSFGRVDDGLPTWT